MLWCHVWGTQCDPGLAVGEGILSPGVGDPKELVCSQQRGKGAQIDALPA